jgi:hypothetical protein
MLATDRFYQSNLVILVNQPWIVEIPNIKTNQQISHLNDNINTLVSYL